VVRVRTECDMDEGVRVVQPRRAVPGTGLAGAVLAVADELRLFVIREDDRHALPVALVRLPDEVARRVGVRIDVVVVEVPVLQNDLAVLVRHSTVAGRPTAAIAGGIPVAREPTDGRGRYARVLVQAPGAGARPGQVARRRVDLRRRPDSGAAQLLES